MKFWGDHVGERHTALDEPLRLIFTRKIFLLWDVFERLLGGRGDGHGRSTYRRRADHCLGDAARGDELGAAQTARSSHPRWKGHGRTLVRGPHPSSTHTGSSAPDEPTCA